MIELRKVILDKATTLPSRIALQVNARAPATLRLAQAVPRLPTIHLYAIAQDENGRSLLLQSGLSALIGSDNAAVTVAQESQGIGIVFLIDISGSLGQAQFELIKRSVLAWIESLDPLDRAAVVTFGSSVRTCRTSRPTSSCSEMRSLR
jgi:von Willebrand factor type A domain